jgi:hypothetical protein
MMNILLSREKIDSLEELHQRRNNLKATLDQQRTELEHTVTELRREFRPARIVRNIAADLFKPDKPAINGDEKSGFASNIKFPLQLASDLLVRDPRIAIALRVVTPLVVKYLPELASLAGKARDAVPGRAALLSALRNNVSKLPPAMEKNKIAEMLIAGALVGGAVYYLFYTERGNRWREQIGDLATSTIDEWLQTLEDKLAEAEANARENEKEVVL